MFTIVGFGNPLLDTVVSITTNELFDKYDLEKDGQKEVDDTLMKTILKDLTGNKIRSAGGCAQNTLRILQWLLKGAVNAFIFGAVGDDENAIVLKNLVEADGVKTRYATIPNAPTGTTLALINYSNRSLVAHIGAAEQYTLSNLLSVKDFEEIIVDSHFIYIEGFFLTHRKEVTKHVVNICKEKKKTFIFNLSGQYLVELEPELVNYFAENADILFGNKREFISLAKVMNWDSIDCLISALLKNYKGSSKHIVVTDGPNDIVCYHLDQVYQISVPSLGQVDNIDTTGAGDAFVAGFIAGLMLEKSPKECARIGCYVSSHVIKTIGCSLPNVLPNIEEALNYK